MLGYSYRRQLIDQDLRTLDAIMEGVVLDVGGKKCHKRGYFQPKNDHIERWVDLNINPNDAPDVIGNGMQLPIRDASIDWVICTEVIQFIDKPEKLISEIKRILRPAGHLFITCPFLYRIHDEAFDLQRFTRKKFEQLLREASFKIVWTKSYGFFFSVIADFIKSALSHLKQRWFRVLISIFTVPVLFIMRIVDGFGWVQKSKFFTSFTTGYGALTIKNG